MESSLSLTCDSHSLSYCNCIDEFKIPKDSKLVQIDKDEEDSIKFFVFFKLNIFTNKAYMQMKII